MSPTHFLGNNGWNIDKKLLSVRIWKTSAKEKKKKKLQEKLLQSFLRYMQMQKKE